MSDHPIEDPGSKLSRTPNKYFGRLLETELRWAEKTRSLNPVGHSPQGFSMAAFVYMFLFGPMGKREREQAPLRLHLEGVPKAIPTPRSGPGPGGLALRSKMAPTVLDLD